MYVRQAPCCLSHFSGSGEHHLPHFVGGPLFQVGSGFFTDMYQRLYPILTKRVSPYIGRKLLSTGRHVVDEMNQGSSFKDALRKGIGQTYQTTKDEFLQKLRGSGHKRRHKRKNRSSSPSFRTQYKRRKVGDFFDS